MADEREPQDPERDPNVARLLESSEVPQVDWTAFEEDALRTRIVARAGQQLDDRATGRTAWWVPLSRWTRPALPVGAAACLALVVGLFLFEPPAAETTIESVATGETASERLTNLLGPTAETDPAAGLLVAESRSDFLTAVLEYPTDGSSSGVSQ